MEYHLELSFTGDLFPKKIMLQHKHIKTPRWLAAGAILSVSATLVGCGGGGLGPSTGTGSGTLQVAMVDAPALDISSLDVTISKVQAHVTDFNNANDTSDANFQTLSTGAQTINLFPGTVKAESLLGSAMLPSGHYSQVRLFVTSATVTNRAGDKFPVTVPSGAQSGLKVNVDYTINSNNINTVLLDFDIAHSLVQEGNGQYRLKPVIRGIVKVLSGTITGTVTDASGAPLTGAVVTATSSAGTGSSITLPDGTFKVWALLPGTYTLSVSDASGVARTIATGTSSGLSVVANQNTGAGTLQVQ